MVFGLGTTDTMLLTAIAVDKARMVALMVQRPKVFDSQLYRMLIISGSWILGFFWAVLSLIGKLLSLTLPRLITIAFDMQGSQLQSMKNPYSRSQEAIKVFFLYWAVSKHDE